MIVYAIVTTALLKAEGHFYSYSLFDGQTKLADLEANSFANAFYGFSPMFQAYIGYAILLGLVLLSFRQTQRMGNLLLGAILINAVMLNISFESCFVFKNSIYLAVVAYFVLNDLPSYLTFFTKQQNIAEYRYHPLTDNTHLHNSSSLMKMILLVGLFYYNQDYIKDTKNYRSRNAESPITGVWQIIELKFFQEEIDTQDKMTIESFESIILDKGRYGAVKIADSLSFFEYLIVPDDNHLEIWNFQDFYELDIKGRYTQINNDSMIYTGRNNNDSLTITMKRNIDSE
jgi:hypothetical protein